MWVGVWVGVWKSNLVKRFGLVFCVCVIAINLSFRTLCATNIMEIAPTEYSTILTGDILVNWFLTSIKRISKGAIINFPIYNPIIMCDLSWCHIVTTTTTSHHVPPCMAPYLLCCV